MQGVVALRITFLSGVAYCVRHMLLCITRSNKRTLFLTIFLVVSILIMNICFKTLLKVSVPLLSIREELQVVTGQHYFAV